MTNPTPTPEPGQRGAQLVADYRASGKTQAEYCRETRISVSTLQYHGRRQRKSEPTRFVPVKVTAHGSGAATAGIGTLAIVLRNGRRVEMGWSGDAKGLNHLLASLEGE